MLMIIKILSGVVLAILVARSQTLPIREIESAVRTFTRGDLTRRVELNCGGELEQLGHSINRMAGELSNMEQSRRSFVANVSHELRSPIPEEEKPRYLQVVLDETNRLTDLVRDLLDLSRLESGKFPMDIAPFDANEMMRRIQPKTILYYGTKIAGVEGENIINIPSYYAEKFGKKKK